MRQASGSGYAMHYFTTDHLGSTRLVTDASGSVREQFDYLPFGELCQNSGLAVANQAKTDYLYSGKELQQFFGINWYDSFSRFQTTSGVFSSPDPLGELTPDFSPYAYASCNPLRFIDPVGLTAYIVGGEEKIIDDGYDDSVEVSRSEFRRLQRRFRYSDSRYLKLRQKLMDKHGYTTGDGQYVIAASHSTASVGESDPFIAVAALAAVDLSIPDPTDACNIKVGIEGVLFLAATAYDAQALIAKRDREIARLMRKAPGPWDYQYALLATSDGFYISYTYGDGEVFLKKGDVWKYGETMNPKSRYSKSWLRKMKLNMVVQSEGTKTEMKIEEKEKIYNYYLKFGHLPPGNKIFR